MNIGSMGILTGAAGSQLPQARGTDADTVAKQTGDAKRAADSNSRAASAEGVGQTEADEGAQDRDADGRRLWEQQGEPQAPEEPPAEEQQDGQPETHRSKDPTGAAGNLLDLMG